MLYSVTYLYVNVFQFELSEVPPPHPPPLSNYVFSEPETERFKNLGVKHSLDMWHGAKNLAKKKSTVSPVIEMSRQSLLSVINNCNVINLDLSRLHNSKATASFSSGSRTSSTIGGGAARGLTPLKSFL